MVTLIRFLRKLEQQHGMKSTILIVTLTLSWTPTLTWTLILTYHGSVFLLFHLMEKVTFAVRQAANLRMLMMRKSHDQKGINHYCSMMATHLTSAICHVKAQVKVYM